MRTRAATPDRYELFRSALQNELLSWQIAACVILEHMDAALWTNTASRVASARMHQRRPLITSTNFPTDKELRESIAAALLGTTSNNRRTATTCGSNADCTQAHAPAHAWDPNRDGLAIVHACIILARDPLERAVAMQYLKERLVQVGAATRGSV